MRIVLTLAVIVITGLLESVYRSYSTLQQGKLGGTQFNPSDSDYLQFSMQTSMYHYAGLIIALGSLALIVCIWYKPVSKLLVTVLVALGVLAGSIVQPAEAYYDKTNYTENYFIRPNESAFWIPDTGDNVTSQAEFMSESYLKQKKVAGKRLTIAHEKLTNSGFWSDFYVPVGRLIVVDRSSYNRVWHASTAKGTSAKDEGMNCQSTDGNNISTSIGITASIAEAQASTYLYNFGTVMPKGDPNDPLVIFTSVYQGRSLVSVMDTIGWTKVHAVLCNLMSRKTLDQVNHDLGSIMEETEKQTREFFAAKGITIEVLGNADTLTFSDAIQTEIDAVVVAMKRAEALQIMAPNLPVMQAVAINDAIRTISNKWNGSSYPTLPSVFFNSMDVGNLAGNIKDLFLKSGTSPVASAK
jgi:hypothetical protein